MSDFAKQIIDNYSLLIVLTTFIQIYQDFYDDSGKVFRTLQISGQSTIKSFFPFFFLTLPDLLPNNCGQVYIKKVGIRQKSEGSVQNKFPKD